jgi:hypothetical protein
MAKFEMSKKEELDLYRRIFRKSFIFAFVGTFFVAIYFFIAGSINIVSSPITLTSLVLVIIVAVAWIYVAAIGFWIVVSTIHLTKKAK